MLLYNFSPHINLQEEKQSISLLLTCVQLVYYSFFIKRISLVLVTDLSIYLSFFYSFHFAFTFGKLAALPSEPVFVVAILDMMVSVPKFTN